MAPTTYEYKFVKIELKTGFKAIRPKEDYHEAIHSLSKEGWRLVQVFAPSTASFGLAPYFELILERPRE
jgi:asparagine synthetase A